MSSPPESELSWQVLARREISAHRIFRLEEVVARHVTSGNETVFSVIRGPDWVNVICLTARDDVVLVRQYRAGADAITLELPGGVIDEGESALQAARRELREETGYDAPHWIELGWVLPNPALQSNHCHTWLATDAVPVGEPCGDPDEKISVVAVPLSDIPALIKDHQITHALVLAAFAHLTLRAGGWHRPPHDG